MTFSRKGTAAVAALLVISGLTGFKFITSREKPSEGIQQALPPSEPRPATPLVTIYRPDPAVGQLKNELDALKDEVKTINAQAPAAADPSPEPEAAPDATLATVIAEAKAEADRYDDRIQREPVDRNFSLEVTPRVNEFFQKPELTGSTMTRMDCASTLCRVGVRHDNVAARQAFLERVASMIPANSELFAHLDDQRDLEIEVYFSRSGGLPGAKQAANGQ